MHQYKEYDMTKPYRRKVGEEHYVYPTFIGHRGAGKAAPENTMAAFQFGLEQGFTMFECDVKLSADNELFLLHDAHLERTTNGAGLAVEKSWKELLQLDAGSWHSSQFKGEALADFATVIDFILDQRVRLDVEIKPDSADAYETGKAVAQLIERKVKARLEQCVDIVIQESHDQLFERLYNELLESPTPYCVKKQFLISSFNVEALRGAYDHVRHVPRALLIDDWSMGEQYTLEILETLDCAGMITNYQILTDALIEKCHAAGRFVMVYTPNGYDEIQSLLDRGVNSIITDNMQVIQTFGNV